MAHMCVSVRRHTHTERERRRVRNIVCLVSCETAGFHCYHHAFSTMACLTVRVRCSLTYQASSSHIGVHTEELDASLPRWEATLRCCSFMRRFFPFAVCLCPRFFCCCCFFFLFALPASVPCSVHSCDSVFVTQVRDERVRFQRAVQLCVFVWSCPTDIRLPYCQCQRLLFCNLLHPNPPPSQALLVSLHRLPNRPHSTQAKLKCPGVCHLGDTCLVLSVRNESTPYC